MDNLPAEPTNIKWKDPSDNAIVNGSDYTQVDGSFDTDYQNTTLTIADASDYTSDQSFSCIFTVQGTSIGGSVVVDVVSITTTDSYKLDDVTATISCALGAVASDNSPTAVQWFKSSVEQTNSTSDITVYSADDFTSSQLESDADSTDATYTCKFTFATGTPESSVTVDVVTITTTHDHVAKDTAATVTCALTDSATEPTDVLWYLDSTLLSNGSSGYTIDEGTYDATNDNQTTTLTQASQGSSVTYTCTFEIGGYNISGNVDADVAEVTATGHTILSGDSTTLSCSIDNSPSAPTIAWTDIDEDPVTSVEGSYTGGAQNSTLALTSVTADAIYTCSFSAGDFVITKTVVLDVVTITTTPSVALSGESVTLSCSLAGSQTEPTEFTWGASGATKTTDDVTDEAWNSGAGSQVSKFEESALNITTDYECAVEIGDDTLTKTSITATVVTMDTTGSVIIEGSSTATLTCELSDLPEAPSAIVWKNSTGDTITSGSDYTITDGSYSSNSQNTILEVLDASTYTADETFTCIFTVQDVEVEGEVDIDVVTMTVYNSVKLSADTATISCELTDVSSDSTLTGVQWFKSSVEQTNSTTDITVYSADDFTSSQLESDADSTDATYTCKFTFDINTVESNEAWNSADGSQVSKFTESIINATTDYECASEIGDDTLTVTSITATVITLTSAGAVILEGSTSAVTLVCEMDNLPAEPTNIKWKDPSDNAIVNGSDYTQVDGSFDTDYQNTTLTIADASDYTSDQSFSCIFTVQGTSIGGSVVVDVVSITTTDSYKLDDVTATISCALGAVASDNSPTAVQWFKSSVEQTNSTSDITVYSADDFTSSQLESDADSTDATYTCKFTFATGTPESSVTVDVVTITTTHDHVAKDTAATVTCALTDSATEPTDVLWYLDSTLLSNGSSGYTIDEGTYDATNDNQTTTLTQASQGSSVTYTCTFEIGGYNISGNVDADVAEVTATGHTILSGDSTTLSCSIDNSPSAPTIAWTDNDEDPVTSVEGSYSGGAQNSTLALTSVTADAIYTCSFSAGDFVITKTVVLDVVTITTTPSVALSGESVTLSCSLAGSQTEPTEFTWGASGATKTTDDVTDEAWNSADGSQVSKFEESALNITTDYECAVEIGDDTLTKTSITATVVTMDTTGTVIIEGSSTATLTCELSDLPEAPSAIVWKNSTGDTITSGSDYTITDGSYSSNTQNTILEVLDASSYTDDETFTCIFTVQDVEVEGEVDIDVVTMTVYNSVKLSAATATISCELTEVSSDSTLTGVQWFKSSVEQTNSTSDITVYSADDFTSSQLESDADSTDATYTCKFTFDTNTVESSVTVDVVTITTAGENATVSCTIADYQTAPVSASWSSGGNDISDGASGITIDDTATSPELIESGLSADKNFTCKFTFGTGDVAVDISQDVTVDFYTISSNSTIVLATSDPTVSCDITGLQNAPSAVAWSDSTGTLTHDGSSVTIDTDTWADGDQASTLTVSALSADKTFTCTFTLSSSALRCLLRLVDVVTITAVDAVVLAGSDGNLTCTLSDAEASVSNPTVTWIDTSDSSEVDSANVETDGLESILMLSTVNSDATYSCSFAAGDGTVAVTATVDKVVVTTTEAVILDGDTATISCAISENSLSVTAIQWEDSGETALVDGAGGATLTTASSNLGLQLDITSITTDTNFTCRATFGTSGSVSEASLIDVANITAVPAYLESGGDAVMSCTVEDLDDSNDDLAIASWESASTAISSGISGTNLSTILTVTGLTIDTDYTCAIAFTGKGSISADVTADVVTITTVDAFITTGENATVSCTIADYQTAPVSASWSSGGNDISDGASGITIDDTATSPELIESGLSADKNFTCKFTFGTGDVAVDISQDVTVDFYTISSNSTIVLATSDPTVSCDITGLQNAPSAVAWSDSTGTLTHDGSSVTIDTDTWADGDQASTLTVSALSADKTFTCTFTLSSSADATEEALVDVVTITAVDAVVLAGSDGNLTCTLSDAEASVSNPTVTWIDTSDSSEVDSANVETDGLESILMLSTVNSDATYSCSFAAGDGTVAVTATVDKVVVTTTEAVILDGDTATISCAISENSLSVTAIQWEDSGETALVDGAGGATLTTASSNLGLQLDITSITTDTNFTCRATFGTSGSVSEASLIDVANITAVPAYLESGGDAVMSCTVEDLDDSNDDLAIASWESASTAISSGISGTNLSTILTVTGLTIDTDYTCAIAFTGKGSISADVTADVVTITTVDAIITTGENATVSCTIADYQTAPVSASWSSGGNDISDGASGITIDDTATSPELIESGLSADKNFTCKFTFGTGDVAVDISQDVTVDFYTISSNSTIVLATSDPTVSCDITGLQNAPSAVAWSDSTGTLTHDGSSVTIDTDTWADGDQASTLTVSALSADKTFTCTFTLSSSADATEEALVDVVTITAVDAVVLAGSDGNLTCTLSDAEASVSNPTVTWIDTSDSSEVDSANVETDGLESILMLSTVNSDATYSCSFAAGDGTVAVTATVDKVVVTTTEAVILDGDTATISCAISENSLSVTAIQWEDSGETALVDGAGGATLTTASSNLGLQLDITSITTDTNFTCRATFGTSGSVSEASLIDVANITAVPAYLESGGDAVMSCTVEDLDDSNDDLAIASWEDIRPNIHP
eukprot:sb/3460428/